MLPNTLSTIIRILIFYNRSGRKWVPDMSLQELETIEVGLFADGIAASISHTVTKLWVYAFELDFEDGSECYKRARDALCTADVRRLWSSFIGIVGTVGQGTGRVLIKLYSKENNLTRQPDIITLIKGAFGETNYGLMKTICEISQLISHKRIAKFGQAWGIYAMDSGTEELSGPFIRTELMKKLDMTMRLLTLASTSSTSPFTIVIQRTDRNRKQSYRMLDLACPIAEAIELFTIIMVTTANKLQASGVQSSLGLDKVIGLQLKRASTDNDFIISLEFDIDELINEADICRKVKRLAYGQKLNSQTSATVLKQSNPVLAEGWKFVVVNEKRKIVKMTNTSNRSMAEFFKYSEKPILEFKKSPKNILLLAPVGYKDVVHSSLKLVLVLSVTLEIPEDLVLHLVSPFISVLIYLMV